ncbi:MAG: hypothetical protein EOS05_36605 [Mesorhizobium sp.]|nr:MAG: hypothetical protein EOS05_36605 [Mesorhizobium sp.]
MSGTDLPKTGGASGSQVKILGVSQPTAWRMGQALRLMAGKVRRIRRKRRSWRGFVATAE